VWRRRKTEIRGYSIAPWRGEKLKGTPPWKGAGMLAFARGGERKLRGDKETRHIDEPAESTSPRN